MTILDYIGYSLINIYSLLRPFNYIVEGDDQYYFLLTEITELSKVLYYQCIL